MEHPARQAGDGHEDERGGCPRARGAEERSSQAALGWWGRKCRLESKFKGIPRLPSVANDSWHHNAKELRAKQVDCAKVCIVFMPMLIQTCWHSFEGNYHEHNHYEKENDNSYRNDDMYENKKESKQEK